MEKRTVKKELLQKLIQKYFTGSIFFGDQSLLQCWGTKTMYFNHTDILDKANINLTRLYNEDTAMNTKILQRSYVMFQSRLKRRHEYRSIELELNIRCSGAGNLKYLQNRSIQQKNQDNL